ncbi:MAG: DMT family transporter [Alphaproteobacteria bacterium]|nr:MAG: DMT family transporter [Alphaproteobacteria bacterium]
MTAAGSATEERRRAVALAALVAGAIAMGASVLFVRWADVGPYASAFWRVLLALPFLWVWMRLENRSAAWPRLDRAVLLAGLLFTGDLFFWHLAILGTTVANATFLATTAPIWVALGAWLVLSEAVGSRILIGLALCLLGGFALVGESYGFAPQRLMGDVYGVATAFFFGAYVLAVRAARARHGAAEVMFVSTAVTSVCLFIIALVFEPRILPQSLPGAAALLALAIISQVGGQGLVAVALGTLPATFSSLVIFLEAIAAATFGWLLLDEPLGLAQAFGGVLILFGIWVARPRTGDVVAGP